MIRSLHTIAHRRLWQVSSLRCASRAPAVGPTNSTESVQVSRLNIHQRSFHVSRIVFSDEPPKDGDEATKVTKEEVESSTDKAEQTTLTDVEDATAALAEEDGEITASTGEDGENAVEETKELTENEKKRQEHIRLKNIAKDYNARKEAYRKQVSGLRKVYAAEVAVQQAADKAAEEKLRRERTRKRLERQRRKNEQSAQNAIRQEELRQARAREFAEYLDKQAEIRKEKTDRYNKARKMVLDDLEEESHLWMTTHDEVDASFTPEAEQLLWGRPGGILGAPNPSVDTHFWQYETHTWKADRIYKSPRQMLLEKIDEQLYDMANIDSTFWTEERIQENVKLETKARLRAMVHSVGRQALLKKQVSMLQEIYTIKPGDIPIKAPAANYRILDNDRAVEKEGARLLLEDPTRFFVFPTTRDSEAASTVQSRNMNNVDDASAISMGLKVTVSDASLAEQISKSSDLDYNQSSDANYSGPTLGSPVGLRDYIRESQGGDLVFPLAIGKAPKKDKRSEREKKQEQREKRLLAAAQAEAAKTGDDDDELAVGQDFVYNKIPDIDYDAFQMDSDDEEEGAAKDEKKDSQLDEGDVEWVIERLQERYEAYNNSLAVNIEAAKRRLREELTADMKADEKLDVQSLEDKMLNMNDTELFVLSDLAETFEANNSISDDELIEAASKIRNMDVAELRSILQKYAE